MSHPPMTAPTIPTTRSPRIPLGASPGTTALAKKPARMPTIIHHRSPVTILFHPFNLPSPFADDSYGEDINDRERKVSGRFDVSPDAPCVNATAARRAAMRFRKSCKSDALACAYLKYFGT